MCLDPKGEKRGEGVGSCKELLLSLYMYLSVKVLGRKEMAQQNGGNVDSI